MSNSIVPYEKEWSTASVNRREQFAYWCDAICEKIFHVDINRDNDGPFDGSMMTCKMGAVTFNRVKSDPHVAELTKFGINRFDSHCYKFHIQNNSVVKVIQHGTENILQPGDAILIDCYYPFRLDFPRLTDSFSVKIPREILRPFLKDPKTASSVPVSGTSSLGMAIKHYVHFLISQSRTQQTIEQTQLYLNSLLGLISSAVSASTAGWEDYYRENVIDKIVQIKSFILENLHDPEMTPAKVADYFSISVSYLHKLFAKENNTFGQFIRERRLDMAAEYLRNQPEKGLTVTDLVYQLGFNDLSHFWRLFRLKFGMTPRAYQKGFNGS